MVRGRQLSSSPLPGAGAAFSTASNPMPSGPALRSAAIAIALHVADRSLAAESCSVACKMRSSTCAAAVALQVGMLKLMVQSASQAAGSVPDLHCRHCLAVCWELSSQFCSAYLTPSALQGSGDCAHAAANESHGPQLNKAVDCCSAACSDASRSAVCSFFCMQQGGKVYTHCLSGVQVTDFLQQQRPAGVL